MAALLLFNQFNVIYAICFKAEDDENEQQEQVLDGIGAVIADKELNLENEVEYICYRL